MDVQKEKHMHRRAQIIRIVLSLSIFAVLATALAGCGGDTAQDAPDQADGGARKFRVAMEAGYAPYNWTQPTDENGAVPIADSSEFANGYDVMMAKKIADENGWDLEIVKLDWDSLVMAVQSGTVDAAIAGQSITPDRAEMVDFSDPYYFATIATLVKKDSPYADAKSVADLDGARVTSQMNTIWYDVCVPQIPNGDVLPASPDAPSMLVQLDANAVDIIVTDRPTAQAATVAYPDFVALDFGGGAEDFEVSEADVNIGVSVQKGNSDLLAGINEVLGGMTPADFDSMMEDAIAIQPLSE